MGDKSDRIYTSPMEVVISLVGGKWKVQILYALWYGPLRFSELSRIIPNITQRMLTNQLREMEADGIVDRKVYEQVPPKVEYSISEYGNSLRPILLSMYRWGYYHIKKKDLAYQPIPKPLRHRSEYVEDILLSQAMDEVPKDKPATEEKQP